MLKKKKDTKGKKGEGQRTRSIETQRGKNHEKKVKGKKKKEPAFENRRPEHICTPQLSIKAFESSR